MTNGNYLRVAWMALICILGYVPVGANAASDICCVYSKDAAGNEKDTFTLGEKAYFHFYPDVWSVKTIAGAPPGDGYANIGWSYSDGCVYAGKTSVWSYGPPVKDYVSFTSASCAGSTSRTWNDQYTEGYHVFPEVGWYVVYANFWMTGTPYTRFEFDPYIGVAKKTIYVVAAPTAPPASSPPTASISKVLPVIISFLLN